MEISGSHATKIGIPGSLPRHDGLWRDCISKATLDSTSLLLKDSQDAPLVPPESMSNYGFKRAADDIKELAKQLGSSRVILGGHDW